MVQVITEQKQNQLQIKIDLTVAEALNAGIIDEKLAAKFVDYGCAMFNLNDAGYSRSQGSPVSVLKKMQSQIAKEDIHEKGVEDELHITVKYGLHTTDAAEVAAVVKLFGPVNVKLGKTSVFSADDKDYDVVKVEVISDDLRRLNKEICDSSLKYTDTHPTYRPHLTLAYVKKGAGKKYAGMTDVDGMQMVFDDLVFSDKGKEKTKISLVAPNKLEKCGGPGSGIPGPCPQPKPRVAKPPEPVESNLKITNVGNWRFDMDKLPPKPDLKVLDKFDPGGTMTNMVKLDAERHIHNIESAVQFPKTSDAKSILDEIDRVTGYADDKFREKLPEYAKWVEGVKESVRSQYATKPPLMTVKANDYINAAQKVNPRVLFGVSLDPVKKVGHWQVLGSVPGVPEGQPTGVSASRGKLWEPGAAAVERSGAKDVIFDYTKKGYLPINESLRDGKPTRAASKLAKAVEDHSIPIPEGLKLRRMHKGHNEPNWGDVQVGSVIADRGVLSTTAFENLLPAGGGGIQLHLTAGPGVRGLPVKSVSWRPDEEEVLFAPNQKILVTRIKHTRKTEVEIYGVVLPSSVSQQEEESEVAGSKSYQQMDLEEKCGGPGSGIPGPCPTGHAKPVSSAKPKIHGNPKLVSKVSPIAQLAKLNQKLGELNKPDPKSSVVNQKLPPPPDLLTGKKNPDSFKPHQDKMNAVYEAAKSGDVKKVEAVKVNMNAASPYPKKVAEYKKSVLEAMGKGWQADPSHVLPTAPPKISPLPAAMPTGSSAVPAKPAASLSPPTNPPIVSKVEIKEDLGWEVDPKKLPGRDGDLVLEMAHYAVVDLNGWIANKVKGTKTADSAIGVFKSATQLWATSPKMEAWKAAVENSIREQYATKPPEKTVKAEDYINAASKINSANQPITQVGKWAVFEKVPGVLEGVPAPTTSHIDKDKLWADGKDAAAKSGALTALRSYTKMGYAKINETLRNGNPTPAAKKCARALMVDGVTLPEGLRLKRSHWGSSTMDWSAVTPGTVIADRGVLSTTTSDYDYGSGPVHLTLVAGPGVKGIPARYFSGHPGENEVLLPPNQRILVTKVEVTGSTTYNQVRRIHGIILPTDSSQYTNYPKKGKPKKPKPYAGSTTSNYYQDSSVALFAGKSYQQMELEEKNCGIGSHGFLPGNQCAKGLSPSKVKTPAEAQATYAKWMERIQSNAPKLAAAMGGKINVVALVRHKAIRDQALYHAMTERMSVTAKDQKTYRVIRKQYGKLVDKWNRDSLTMAKKLSKSEGSVINVLGALADRNVSKDHPKERRADYEAKWTAAHGSRWPHPELISARSWEAVKSLPKFKTWIKNCGIGSGGFLPGNQCAKGGGEGPTAKQDEHGKYVPGAVGKTLGVDTSKWNKEDVSAQWAMKGLATLEDHMEKGNYAAAKNFVVMAGNGFNSGAPSEYSAAYEKHSWAAIKDIDTKIKNQKISGSGEWKKVGGKLGTEEGGLYEHGGKKYYVKQPKDLNRARNEDLSYKLYELAGAASKKSELIEMDGKKVLATEWLDKVEKVDWKDTANKDAASKDFAVHVWLNNRDAIGAGYENPMDNIRKDPATGKMVMIDAGGSLNYKGMGGSGKKDFGKEVKEWDGFRNPNVNASTAEVFGKMTPQQMIDSASKLHAVKDNAIRELAKKYGNDDHEEIAEILIARKNAILGISKKLIADTMPKSMKYVQANAKIQAADPDIPPLTSPMPAVKAMPPAVPPPPDVVGGKTGDTWIKMQAKYNEIHEAAKAGDLDKLEKIKPNYEAKSPYPKKLAEYHKQVVAAVKAGGTVDKDQPVPKNDFTTTQKVDPGKFPPVPIEPKQSAVIAESLAHAAKGDLTALMAMKIQSAYGSYAGAPNVIGNWHAQLIANVSDQLYKPVDPTRLVDDLRQHIDKVDPFVSAGKIGEWNVVGKIEGAPKGKPLNHSYKDTMEPGVGPEPQHQKEFWQSGKKMIDKTGIKEAVEMYTDDSYEVWNSQLRQSAPYNAERAIKMAKAIMDHGVEIPVGLKLTRIHKETDWSKVEPGTVIADKGLLSTSTNDQMGATNLELTVGPGVKGLPVRDYSAHASENEVVLPPNQKIMVTRIDKIKREYMGKEYEHATVYGVILPTDDYQCCPP